MSDVEIDFPDMREDLKEEIRKDLEWLEEKGVNMFQRGAREMNLLNPYFGFRASADPNRLNERGVHSIWMSAGVERISVHILPFGYARSTEINKATPDMTLKELTGVRDMLQSMVAEKKKELDEYSQNPPLDELLPEISRWAAEVAAAAGPQYKAEIRTGRRACDSVDYKAVVVTDRGDQLGSIPLRQDRFGMLTYNIQIPLSGQYAEDFKLDVKDFKNQLHKAIEEVARKRIVIPSGNEKRISSPEITRDGRGGFYVNCRIDGEQQMRTRLDNRDVSRVVNTTRDGYHWDAMVFELAAKYYKDALDNRRERDIGRTR